VLAELAEQLMPGAALASVKPSARGRSNAGASGMRSRRRIGAASGELVERFEDGRPKRWPTLQLRVRGKPFDVYCEHSSDVTLDGIGIPVVSGRTVSREDLARGWFDSRLASLR
jgi:hypothetical protein